MQEPVTCPSCFARYGLRTERVTPEIKRAQCFKCNYIFGIETEVARLCPTRPSTPPPSEASTQQFQTAAMRTGPGVPEMEDSGLVFSDVEESLLEIQALSASVSGDNVSRESAKLQGYSSAKDAISKLLGGTPEPPPVDRRVIKGNNPMDVEATLDALENTLGGINPKDLEGLLSKTPPPQPPPPAQLSSLGTVKLSNEEIRAAMAAGQAGQEETSLQMPVSVQKAPVVPPSAPSSTAHSEDLLRVKVGNDIYPGLTQENLIGMIEDGRVQDWNLVARQHSENWIEAGKIPALRHTFENQKRRQNTPPLPEMPAAEPAPQKRSLFSGLFGRH